MAFASADKQTNFYIILYLFPRQGGIVVHWDLSIKALNLYFPTSIQIYFQHAGNSLCWIEVKLQFDHFAFGLVFEP